MDLPDEVEKSLSSASTSPSPSPVRQIKVFYAFDNFVFDEHSSTGYLIDMQYEYQNNFYY